MGWHSLRIRLTLWYSLALALGLLALAGSVWGLLRYRLEQDVEQSTTARLESLRQFLDAELLAADFADEWEEYARAIPQGTLVEILTDTGQRLAWHPGILSMPLQGRDQSFSWQGQRYLLRTATVFVRGRRYELRAAESLRLAEELSLRLLWLFGAVSPFVLLLAGTGGYWLSRRALAPVAALTQHAASLSVENLSLRLPVAPTGDELQGLAETYNHMLDRLERAVARLSQFTADASHELRTPLALIRTTAELALRRERSVDTYRIALQSILRETERTTQLVEDLLALARADAGYGTLSLTHMDLQDVIADVGSHYAELALAQQVKLVLPLRASTAAVNGNAAALRRVLLILLDNALKYTPPGGRIVLTLEQDAGNIALSVADTGVGIAADVLPHVFERFYRADPSRHPATGGHGLGLSIAQWIVQNHHATFSVESAIGQGSVFRIVFPAPQDASTGVLPHSLLSRK